MGFTVYLILEVVYLSIALFNLKYRGVICLVNQVCFFKQIHEALDAFPAELNKAAYSNAAKLVQDVVR